MHLSIMVLRMGIQHEQKIKNTVLQRINDLTVPGVVLGHSFASTVFGLNRPKHALLPASGFSPASHALTTFRTTSRTSQHISFCSALTPYCQTTINRELPNSLELFRWRLLPPPFPPVSAGFPHLPLSTFYCL